MFFWEECLLVLTVRSGAVGLHCDTLVLFRSTAHRFDPAKALFDPLANALAGLIAAPRGRASIQSREVNLRRARHMRRESSIATPVHEVLAMISLVGPHRFLGNAFVQLLVRVHLAQGQQRLGFGDGVVEREVGAQAVPVLYQDVAAKAQPGLFTLRLALAHALEGGGVLWCVSVQHFSSRKFTLGLPRSPSFADWTLAASAPSLRTNLFTLAHASMSVSVAVKQACLTDESLDLGEEESGHIGGEDAIAVSVCGDELGRKYPMFAVSCSGTGRRCSPSTSGRRRFAR